MLALAKGELGLSARLESHLDRCLACRACENVCPSNVAYGLALDATRALIHSNPASIPQAGKWPVTLIQWLVENPARMRWLARGAWLYQRSGLQWLLRKSRVLKPLGLAGLDNAIAKLPIPRAFAPIYPVENRPRGRISLFIGCQANMADRQALDAAIRLLNKIGYEVDVPPNQGCCGALHLHDGQGVRAAQLMQRNIDAFGRGNDAILSVAAGCTATLKEYGKYLKGDVAADQLRERVMDISQFIAETGWPQNISLRSLPRRIAVHDPCTLTNVLHQKEKPYALLSQIPEAEVFPLPENSTCCGAAGAYYLTQGRIAEQLRVPKIEHLRRLAPDILVTSNPGCAAFLATGLREAGLAMEVMHPVVLLEKQLQKG